MTQVQHEWDESEMPVDIPGCVGAFVDEIPLVTHAMLRPYVIAILLHRKAVRLSEIMAAVTPHCSSIDLKIGAWGEYEDTEPNKTRLEIIAEEVLGKMVASGLIVYNKSQDFWVLTRGEKDQNLTTVISWVSSLDAQLPVEFFRNATQQKRNKQKNCS
jgi:hypothetical protein